MWIDEGGGQFRKAGWGEAVRVWYRKYALQVASVVALGILAYGFFK